MVSLANPRPPVETADTTNLPELSDAAYFNDVLCLPVEKSEAHVDDELIARARQLGISIPDVSDKRYTSSAESASTAPTYHARTFSTGSNNSTSTALTVHSSIFAPAVSDVNISEEKPKQKQRPPSLSFAQYDKYLTQVDKNLDQPKIKNVSISTANESSSKSLFSVSTKRSLASVKSVVKNRIRWRRKSIQPYVPALYVCPVPVTSSIC